MIDREPPLEDLTPDDEDDLRAAEYVLGVDDAETRAQVARRIGDDAAFAARVADWTARLAPLDDGTPPVAPPAALWSRIEGRLFPAARSAPQPRRDWFAWLAGIGAATALVLAAILVFAPAPAPVPALIATLGAETDALRFEARHDGAELIVTRVAGPEAAEGQTYELWIIAADAAPVSLGLLSDAVLRTAYPLPPPGQTLAVSLEPAGGSPTGAPTGPVLAAGQITDL
jgi:anti-sigma-K factor RskA